MEVEYTSGYEQLLDATEPLWNKLRLHHLDRTRNFAWHYQSQSFARRKDTLLNKIRNGKVKVDLVRNKETGELVGYCVTSITEDNIGELESMYVEACCRSMGVGHHLVERSMEWMTAEQVAVRRVIVAAGNEEVLGFYRRFGFYPRSTILEYLPEGLSRTTMVDHVTEAR